jgi:NADH dehydrogenase
MDDQIHDVIVVGGGFAGVAAAEKAARLGLRVLLIDKNPFHQFQPLLYQVATSQISVAAVARPLRSIFRRRRRVQLRIAEVTAIDPAERSVTTSDGATFRGRSLVIAIGAEPNFFNTPGAQEHAFPLYSVADATALASRLLGLIDGATSRAPARPFDVVVVGGGPTGVETAGAIAENLAYVIPRYVSPAFASACTVHLVDMVDSVLTPFSEASQRYAQRRLAKVGVDIKLGSGVTEVTSEGVTLADGTRIETPAVVWAGGLKGSTLLGKSGLPLGRGGRVDVASDLTVPGFERVYALGDAANIADRDGQPLPQLGSVALQAGAWAGRNVHAQLSGQPTTPFEYRDKGVMAMIGRGAAVAELGRKRWGVRGPLAFIAWLAVHVMLLSGIPQRVSAAVSWAWDYFTRRRPQVVVYRPEVYERGHRTAARRDESPGTGGLEDARGSEG